MVMDNDSYPEILSRFKENEKPEAILMLENNPGWQKIVIAWLNIKVNRQENKLLPPKESEGELWEWLWKHMRFSKKELIAVQNNLK